MTKKNTSAQGLDYAMAYLSEVLKWRLGNMQASAKSLPAYDSEQLGNSGIAHKIEKLNLQTEEVVVLLLALSPYLKPELIGEAVASVFPHGGELPEMGGVKGTNHRGILPTGETALFIIGGNIAAQRIDALRFINEQSKLIKKEIVSLEFSPKGEPFTSGRLTIAPDLAHQLLTGKIPNPKLSIDFPAEKLETQLEWEDLILAEETLEEIKEIETWLKFQEVLSEKYDLKKKFKPGYKALFHGPPGTGKTLTASLLGKYTNRDVYRVDLSVVVSKYIGETEKNLSSLFDKAKSKNWILFFDEADSIFGKRTSVRDAHDKYANQEVSYLLQRLESHPGLVILASNFKHNIDAAFTRRFQSLVAFKNPSYKERLRLWQSNVPAGFTLDEAIDINQVAKNYEVTGANILNIMHYCCLFALKRKKEIIDEDVLIAGLKREYKKEDKMF